MIKVVIDNVVKNVFTCCADKQTAVWSEGSMESFLFYCSSKVNLFLGYSSINVVDLFERILFIFINVIKICHDSFT